jgi:hypothetical protein
VSDLEHALRELDVDWPATPDLATAVMARIATEAGAPARRRLRLPSPDGWRARLAYFAAALAIAAGGTLAVSPAARSTVLEWLGLKSVRIERTEPRIGASLDLGPAIALPEGTREPEALGEPEAYDTTLPDGSKVVSLVYEGPILVQVFRARATPFIEKTLGQGARAERVPDGYWITGSHGFAYETATGFGYEQPRLADKTLLIERDGLLIRVEGDIAKARALAIADSIQ